MFALLIYFCRIEKIIQEDNELGGLAVQAYLCTHSAGVDLVYDPCTLRVVLYTEQSKTHIWRNGRRAKKRNV